MAGASDPTGGRHRSRIRRRTIGASSDARPDRHRQDLARRRRNGDEVTSSAATVTTFIQAMRQIMMMPMQDWTQGQRQTNEVPRDVLPN